MGTKKQIRREILSIRDALSKEERKKKSDRIKKRLAELPVFEQADQLLIYAGYGSEVETDAIMELAFRKRKLVFCPRVEGKKNAVLPDHGSFTACERISQHQGTTAPAAVAAETGGSCHNARNGV